MQKRSSSTPLALLILLLVPAIALSQAAQETRTLIVNGQPGQVSVILINGRSYVDLEALARVANGSLGFNGNQISLTLPGAANAAPPAASSGSPAANPGFSKGFMKAGIEQMSVIREWRSTLISAVQRGYPVTGEWMASFSDRAEYNLRLVSVTASTDSERKTLELITNELNNMKKLSDRFVAANKSMTYMPTTSLDDDPLDRKILNCGHSLAAVAASRQFVDDGSCH